MLHLHPTYVISHSMSETTCTLWMKLIPSCSSSMVARLGRRKRESKQEAVCKKTPTPVHPTPSSHSIHPDLHPLIPKFSKLTPVGFEPTQLALVELESTPLDHLGKVSLPSRSKSCEHTFTNTCLPTCALQCAVKHAFTPDVNGYIAQWLERLTADQQVPGSNPGVPSFANATPCANMEH